jgi:hypothetical protein
MSVVGPRRVTRPVLVNNGGLSINDTSLVGRRVPLGEGGYLLDDQWNHEKRLNFRSTHISNLFYKKQHQLFQQKQACHSTCRTIPTSSRHLERISTTIEKFDASKSWKPSSNTEEY